jgi:hypothetical protein
MKAAGQAASPDGYRRRTLDGTALAAAEALAPRALRPHMLVAMCFAAPLVACASVWAASFNVGQMNTMMANEGAEARVATAFGMVSVVILFAWIAVSFRPLRESLADSAVIVEGTAGSAPEVYAAIRECAETRCGDPFRFEATELDGIPGLVVRNEAEHGLITVRAIGPDLFIGWSLWRRRSTARLIGQILNNLVDAAKFNPYAAAAASSFVVMREQLQCLTGAGADAATS